MTKIIEEVESIFIMGLGRSGLVAKAFAMRLMHLGLNVYVCLFLRIEFLRKDENIW